MRNHSTPILGALACVLTLGSELSAQEAHLPRLSVDLLDAAAPSARVEGPPGRMATRALECRSVPESGSRRRIIDIAAQEWAFFGFPIIDETSDSRLLPPGMGPESLNAAFQRESDSERRYWRRSSPEEAERVASSIAGYWAVTAEGAGIVRRQNDAWLGEDGIASRWVDPWSAAFISWVMCEAGLASPARFQRSIAHRVYIDQAIRARDRVDANAAFVAHDIGEVEVEPGDMLCASSRPPYRNLAERRSQLGVGARTHCDIVVKVDPEGERLLTIGGNVMRSVSLKIFSMDVGEGGRLRPVSPNERRPLFAHLELRGDSVEPDALDHTPTLRHLACEEGFTRSARLALVGSVVGVLPEVVARTSAAAAAPELPSVSLFDERTEVSDGCRAA